MLIAHKILYLIPVMLNLLFYRHFDFRLEDKIYGLGLGQLEFGKNPLLSFWAGQTGVTWQDTLGAISCEEIR